VNVKELGCGSGVVGLTTAALLAQSTGNSLRNTKEESSSVNKRSGGNSSEDGNSDRNKLSESNNSFKNDNYSNSCNINENRTKENHMSGKVILTDLPVYLPAIAGKHL